MSGYDHCSLTQEGLAIQGGVNEKIKCCKKIKFLFGFERRKTLYLHPRLQ